MIRSNEVDREIRTNCSVTEVVMVLVIYRSHYVCFWALGVLQFA